MAWLTRILGQVLTGPDNRTAAIGRVISMGIALVLLTAIPLIAVCHMMAAPSPELMTRAQAWRELLTALGIYVPTVCAAIWGLVFGTNTTEPPARSHDDGDNHNG